MANYQYKAPISHVIKKLKMLRDDPIKIYKQTIVEITHAILWQMAKYTIVDTGQARSAIIQKFSDKYELSYSDLMQESYRFWESNGYPENANRGWGKSDSNLSENIGKKSHNITIDINDDGLYAQEYADSNGVFEGKQYPSNANSHRSNEDYRIRHLTYVSDLINTGNFGSLEKLNYEELVNELASNIEYFIFN